MDPDCRFEIGEVHDDTMSWSVECPVEGGTSRGTWTARSGGDTVSGEGNLSVSFQGQSMEMTMSWEGRRIGDCE